MAKLLSGTRIYGNATVDTNLVVSGTTVSTSTSTGALTVSGGVGVAGNIYIGGNINANTTGTTTTVTKLVTTTGVFWANGTAYSSGSSGGGGTSITYTAATTPPGTANVADQWYNTTTNALYEYINDGTTSYWVDITSPTAIITNTAVLSSNTIITGNFTPSLDATYSLGNSAYRFSSVNVSGNVNAGNINATQYGNSIGTTATYAGNVTVGNIINNGQEFITFRPTTTVGSALQVTAANTKGGTNYADFLTVTNASTGVTNPNKFFRTDVTGTLQIINSAYTAQLMTLTDAGDMTVLGNITASGIKPFYSASRPAFRVYGSTTTQWNTSINSSGYMNSTQYTVDYNTGSYLNTTSGVFTAPVAGLYQVNLNARNAGNTTVISQAIIVKNATGGNGSGGTISLMLEFATSSTMNHAGVGTTLSLAQNDTLVLKISSGTIQFDSNDSWSVAYIG